MKFFSRYFQHKQKQIIYCINCNKNITNKDRITDYEGVSCNICYQRKIRFEGLE